MKILCLYHNECALELFDWIQDRGHETILIKREINGIWCREQKFDLAVSYTYPYIIKNDVIVALNGNVVNLHTSFLPYNRGSYPNVWSILDGTPRGVTLHYISSGLDKGDIIAQVLVPLEQDATLNSSYQKLDVAAKRLFQDSFVYYEHWNFMRKECVGGGSYHNDKDFVRLKENIAKWDWNMKVKDFLDIFGK